MDREDLWRAPVTKQDASLNRTVVNIHLSPDVPLMPDGRPLPDVCTADEVLAYLRMGLDDPGGTKKQRALQPLRERNWLVGFKCGRHVMYTKAAVMECRRLMEENGVA